RGITLAWTGLNDHKDNTIDGTFEYLTGIDGFVPLSPLPSNSILKDCAALQVGNENKFEVRSCGGTTKIWSICKMNYFRLSIIFVPAEVPQRDESDGVLTELNWSDADQECKNKGGELMNICGMNSVILRRILRKRNIDTPVWIGMNYDTSKKKFFWRNGVSKFRRWCRGEPSLNPDPLAPNQCVAYIVGGKPRGRGTGKGCIRVEPCGTTIAPNKKMFVCQIKESTNNDLVNDTLNEVEK
uniref:C-type lectin domain-containing protein n=2 Tax=Clytia hemisphaerica TaxID=252671 RepID=A0A7M5UGC8_9CNID